ncbi:MAG: cytochrome-c peroxidase [Bryobacteraceae bacterium]
MTRIITITILSAVAVFAQHGPGMMRAGQPIPSEIPSPANPFTPAKVDLGRMLYFETRLSKNQKISCNTCHPLGSYGADGKRVSTGQGGQEGNRNSPTVYNAAAHFVQFWDGRASDVEEQAKGPVLNPVEMAMPTGDSVVRVLKSIPGYVTAFQAAFPGESDPVTFDNMARAIGVFERKLTTPSRWDKFAGGDHAAITQQEMRGWMTFRHAGCTTCHNGPAIGGTSFQKLGASVAWPQPSDQGRYEVTKAEADRLMFKVPSLRNVEKTGPYFHDGRVRTVEDAVRLMGKHQLGIDLQDSDIESITAWFHTLTGPLPQEYIHPPKLPAGTAETPKPLE